MPWSLMSLKSGKRNAVKKRRKKRTINSHHVSSLMYTYFVIIIVYHPNTKSELVQHDSRNPDIICNVKRSDES